MTFDHIGILALEEMNTPTGVESLSSCVSFVKGILIDEPHMTPVQVFEAK
jgi:hypothetical protein